MAVRHTSCRYCEQDIENISPYRKGEWTDRGGNTTCPTVAGDAGLHHAPYRGTPAFKVGQRVLWCDPDGGICSGRGVIASVRRDTVWLHMDSGSETEAWVTELQPVR